MSKVAVGQRGGEWADSAASLYERDYCGWLQEQATLLRTGIRTGIDTEHIAEELDGLARSEAAKLQSALRVLLIHILKWDIQPERRSRSWLNTIAIQRQHYLDVLEDNPSLQHRAVHILVRAYRLARLEASSETGLPADEFPRTCPYGWDDILARPFEIDR